MHRRDFVSTLGAALLAPAAACAARTGGTSGRRLKRVGLQLYSLRDAGRANLDRTLADIAAAGYDDVEMLMSNGNFGASPAQARAMLDRHGLKAPSTHMNAASLAPAALDRTLDEAATMGHRYLFLAGLPRDATTSLDGFRSWGDRLNEAGAVARRRDVWIGFHNHGSDFVAFDGKIGYDALIDRTDPAVVRMQLDVGNVAMGGHDPIAYMDRYGDRYWSFHIKDVPSMRSTQDAELGKGILDLRGVLTRVKNVDEKLVYVEQESYPGAPIDSIRRDFTYLSTLEF
jgi:sugar phosphate isomerase/epimerase